ncbi:MAG TPA: hypothetical protein PK740_00280, partial [Bacteroidales bacterium]|nr:hypothetical protein [Bacteroidales bacterium]
DWAKLVKKEKNVCLGPASIVCLAGFFKALEDNKIRNGQTILINTGEGAARARDFAAKVTENE